MSRIKIYLDMCSYNRPFDEQSHIKVRLQTEAKLYIQSGAQSGLYSLVWSYMLDYENEENPYEEKKNAIRPWREIADNYCPSSSDILSTGKKYMAYGFKAKDALHIACAVKSGCTYFITTDKKLTNKNFPDIQILDPIDFLRETEDFDNGISEI